MPVKPVFVIDANVIVSAVLLPQSLTRKAFDQALAKGTIAISEAVINELDDVLRRPRLDKYICEEERIQFLMALLRECRLVRVNRIVEDCRYPKDNKYLELALDARAACILSGDKDLLVLHPYHGIPILTPRQFLDAQ
jgi:putative PIN family toxin of toxin-antitoxin system